MKKTLAFLFALALIAPVVRAQSAANVYMEKLPTAPYLMATAKVQGFTVESITQTTDRVVEKCTTATGEVTFTYQTFASLGAQAGNAPVPQPSAPQIGRAHV